MMKALKLGINSPLWRILKPNLIKTKNLVEPNNLVVPVGDHATRMAKNLIITIYKNIQSRH